MANDLDYVKEELARVGYRGWAEVSKGSGVPLSTVKKLGYGSTKSGRYDTIANLAAYFRGQAKPRRNGSRREARAA